MIQVQGLSKSFGKVKAVQNVSFTAPDGQITGLLGPNGAGKSTTLRMLYTLLKPESGSAQVDGFDVREAPLEVQRRIGVLADARGLYPRLTSRENIRYYGRLHGLEGKVLEKQIDSLLALLEMQSIADRRTEGFSTGEKLKVAIARSLVHNPKNVLLDEPTNGLDIETIGWLENFLADYENIVLVVSHDRHFLDAVCTHVADVDRQKIKIFTGNYTFWYESSQLMARQVNDKNKKTEEKRQALLDFIARFSANASKSRQATSRKKALEKLTIEEIEPSYRKYPGIIFQPLREVGNQILNTEKLSKTVDGRTLFSNVTFTVNKGDKIALLSRDPLAVTSFFNIITGEDKADHGSFSWGSTVTHAYLPQENSRFFDQSVNLMDWLRQCVPPHVTDVDEPFLRGFLGKMLFSGDDVMKKTNVLSGGEKVRCMISRMMLQNPNVILLDQPTNHLDLESIQSFNEQCVDYKGIVLLTSHDHTFMQTVANRVIELTPKGIIDRLTTFDEYLEDPRVKNLREEMY